jgi:hypothetical protein
VQIGFRNTSRNGSGVRDCAFCLHGESGVEVKDTRIDHIQPEPLLKLDNTSRTQLISLGQYKVYKLIRKEYIRPSSQPILPLWTIMAALAAIRSPQ